jgi:hypothetical protein
MFVSVVQQLDDPQLAASQPLKICRFLLPRAIDPGKPAQRQSVFVGGA